MQNILNTNVQVATSKMKLQQGNRLSGDKTLSRQTFWVATEITIIQDSVATRTRTKMLSRQEKMGRNTNLKKQLGIIVVTWKLGSRHQLAKATLKLLMIFRSCGLLTFLVVQTRRRQRLGL